jgi:hypothetical protein
MKQFKIIFMDKAESESLLNYQKEYPAEYSKGEKRHLLTQFSF